ncbi:MAG TPA: hypothetical protein ENJ43_05110, partial [Gammaproteobacteria bacterium]|nr:hypothetical protein [Gammaproteobacteria bacterium]
MGLLLLLTVLASLPFDPQGPFDARDYRRAAGVELEFPLSGVVLEPLLAVSAALGGEPDVRIAAGATLIWIVVLTPLLLLAGRVRRNGGIRPADLLAAVAAALAGGGLFLCYLGFVLLVHLPGWKLVTTDPDLIVADLQSHTVYSRDGLVTPLQNLALHRGRGFHVVAFTEHDSPAGTLASTAFSRQDEELPWAIGGTEVREPGGAFVLSVGWIPRQRLWDPEWLTGLERRPVVALAWKLTVPEVRRLAEAGLSGFEIANSGHPDIPLEVRDAILEEARRRGLVLVASSDWHGWSGLWRTWTTVRVAGAARMSRVEKAEAVVEALRQRRGADIQPVVAGYLGPPSLLRTLFAPFSALLRYGMELSLLRLL